MKNIQIAIDGPAGAGKSSIAKALSKKLGILYLETGALYRSIAYNSLKTGEEVVKSLENLQIEVKFEDNLQQVYVNCENVTRFLRTEEVSMTASNISNMPEVREFLLDLQRDIAKKQSVIMDGRDIGTVILPNADIKIFLTASAEKRAKRRFDEMQDTAKYEEILESIKKRDFQDENREIAPTKPAKDAIIIDTTDINLEETITKILDIVNRKIEA